LLDIRINQISSTIIADITNDTNTTATYGGSERRLMCEREGSRICLAREHVRKRVQVKNLCSQV